MIALLAAAVLQAAAAPGISFEEAVGLPANDLAVRVLGEAGRPYVGAFRPSEQQRSPPVNLRFFTRPEAATDRLCVMHTISVNTSASVAGQEALDREPEGWRRYRKLVYGPPISEDLYRPSGLRDGGDFAEAQADCGRLEPQSGPGWFSAESPGSAGLALQFARLLLPSERDGASSTEAAATPDIQPLLARMRLDRLGMVRSSRCNLFAVEPGRCLVLYFTHPDADGRELSLVVSWTSGRNGLAIVELRAIDDFLYVP